MASLSKGPGGKRFGFDWVNGLILVVFLGAAALAGWLAYGWVQALAAGWSMTPLPGMAVNLRAGQSTPTPGGNAAVATGEPSPFSIHEQSGPKPVPWNGASRVTVLIMGLDYRDWAEGKDIPRTDSMILLTVDPLNKTAGMLSIPRDLWVSIPGMGYHKINTAYRWGELYKMPEGGPGLAMKTVETVIGVPVQYYALIDFHSFVVFIDELGGLDMHIRQEITVDPIGPGNTIKLEPGVQNLPGEVVLAYARNRYSGEYDDFDRSARQQEVIMAIREQILTFNMLPTLVAKAPALYEKIAPGIRTNLTLDQVIRLAWLASEIPAENIHKSVFDVHKDFEYAVVETSDGRQDVIIPRPDRMRLVRDEIFATAGALAPMAAEIDPARRVEIENARVVLRDGSGVGAGERAYALLMGQGVQIVETGAADTIYSRTRLIDYTGKPYTLAYVIGQLGIENPEVENRFDPQSPVDVEVILGQDWTGP